MKPSFHERWRRVQSRIAAEVTRLISKPDIEQSLLTSAATILKAVRGSCWLRALWPTRSPWPRYRVTPRVNPAVFRRELLRAIRGELRRSGLHPARVARGNTS